MKPQTSTMAMNRLIRYWCCRDALFSHAFVTPVKLCEKRCYDATLIMAYGKTFGMNPGKNALNRFPDRVALDIKVTNTIITYLMRNVCLVSLFDYITIFQVGGRLLANQR